MEDKLIRTREDFENKLKEIGKIFRFKFESDEYGCYINVKDKRIKMNMDEHGYYYINNGNQKICFKSLFAPHCFSTSALIEMFISDGNNRILCTFQQELRPSCGSDEMPAFTYSEYTDGKTYTFYSNSHQIETIASDTITTLMLDKMIEYENLDISIPHKQTNKRLTRFLFGINALSHNNIAPAAHLNVINNSKGYSINFFKDACSLVYNEYKEKYKQDSKMHYSFLPFLKTTQQKREKQIIRDVDLGEKIPEDLVDSIMSMVKNPDAISCFNSSISHFQNSLAWPYISENYSSQIDYVRKIQNGEVEYENESQTKSINGQPQMKLLKR